MKLRDRRVMYTSPAPATLVYGHSFYTRVTGVEKMCRRSTETRSDLSDSCEEGFSDDNGRTWSPLRARSVVRETPRGVHRLMPGTGFVDPETGRMLTMVIEGVLPRDDAIEDGMRHYYMRYWVSADGGRTEAVDEQVIQDGPPGRYTPEAPFAGVTVGKNSMMLGDLGSATIKTRGGSFLVPVQVCPVGPDGEYINPGGGFTYHDAAVLIGRWANSPGGRRGAEAAKPEAARITWGLSEYIRHDPGASTRGCVEPTLAQMPDGRVLMVLRGSNDVKPELPGHKWYTVSSDEGRTWAPVQPWTYRGGERFFSPSSMSQLIAHSNGRFYWLGNITPQNPVGNGPRYPLVVGEVDPESLMLIKESVAVVDTRGPAESRQMTLSNFFAHEDRVSGEIVLHMSRWMLPELHGDAYVYRIGV